MNAKNREYPQENSVPIKGEYDKRRVKAEHNPAVVLVKEDMMTKSLAIHNIQEDPATCEICVRADMTQAYRYNLMNPVRKRTSGQLLENYSGPDAKRQQHSS